MEFINDLFHKFVEDLPFIIKVGIGFGLGLLALTYLPYVLGLLIFVVLVGLAIAYAKMKGWF